MIQVFSVARHAMGRGPDRRHTVSWCVPLAFSVTGLLVHCLALIAQSDDRGLAPIGFALVAAAPALSALVALCLAGDAGETSS